MAVAGGARLTGLGARSPHGARVAGLRVTLRGTRPEESPQVGRSDRAPLPPGGGTACRRLPRRCSAGPGPGSRPLCPRLEAGGSEAGWRGHVCTSYSEATLRGLRPVSGLQSRGRWVSGAWRGGTQGAETV